MALFQQQQQPESFLGSVEKQRENTEADNQIQDLEKKLTDIDGCLPTLDAMNQAQNNCDKQISEATTALARLKTLIESLDNDTKHIYRDDIARLEGTLQSLTTKQKDLKAMRKKPFDTFADINEENNILSYLDNKKLEGEQTLSDDVSAFSSYASMKKIDKNTLSQFTNTIAKLSGNALDQGKTMIEKSTTLKDKDKTQLITLIQQEIERKKESSPVLLTQNYHAAKEQFDATISSIEGIQNRINNALKGEVDTRIAISTTETHIIQLNNDITKLQTSLNKQNSTSEQIGVINQDLIEKQKQLFIYQGKEVINGETVEKQFVLKKDDATGSYSITREGGKPASGDDILSKPYQEKLLEKFQKEKQEAQNDMNRIFDKKQTASMENYMQRMIEATNNALNSYKTEILIPTLTRKFQESKRIKQEQESIKQNALTTINTIVDNHRNAVSEAIQNNTQIPGFDLDNFQKSKDKRRNASKKIRDAELGLYDARRAGLTQEYITLKQQMKDFATLLTRIGIMLNDGSSLARLGIQLPKEFSAEQSLSLLDQTNSIAKEFQQYDTQVRKASPIASTDAIIGLSKSRELHNNSINRINATNSLHTTMINHYKGLLYRQTKLAHEIQQIEAEKTLYDITMQYEERKKENAINTQEQINYKKIIDEIEKKISGNNKEIEDKKKNNQTNGTWNPGTENVQTDISNLIKQNEALENTKKTYINQLTQHTNTMITSLDQLTKLQSAKAKAEIQLQQIKDQKTKIAAFDKTASQIIIGRGQTYNENEMTLKNKTIDAMLDRNTFATHYDAYQSATSQAWQAVTNQN